MGLSQNEDSFCLTVQNDCHLNYFFELYFFFMEVGFFTFQNKSVVSSRPYLKYVFLGFLK